MNGSVSGMRSGMRQGKNDLDVDEIGLAVVLKDLLIVGALQQVRIRPRLHNSGNSFKSFSSLPESFHP